MTLFHFDALDKQGGHQVAGDVAVFKRDAFRDNQFTRVVVDGAGEYIPLA